MQDRLDAIALSGLDLTSGNIHCGSGKYSNSDDAFLKKVMHLRLHLVEFNDWKTSFVDIGLLTYDTSKKCSQKKVKSIPSQFSNT